MKSGDDCNFTVGLMFVWFIITVNSFLIFTPDARNPPAFGCYIKKVMKISNFFWKGVRAFSWNNLFTPFMSTTFCPYYHVS